MCIRDRGGAALRAGAEAPAPLRAAADGVVEVTAEAGPHTTAVPRARAATPTASAPSASISDTAGSGTGAIEIGAAIFGLGSGGRMVADMGGQLLTLRFGREDESEADLIGIDLSARAGYDPKAGVSLWQKMAVASKGAPPQFLSTHPSGPTRIKDIQAALPQVEPLYARAQKPPRRFEPPPMASSK